MYLVVFVVFCTWKRRELGLGMLAHSQTTRESKEREKIYKEGKETRRRRKLRGSHFTIIHHCMKYEL